MDPIQFCYWLQGAMELLPAGQPLSVDQVNVIKDHLKLVFNKITPERPVAAAPSKIFENLREAAQKARTTKPDVQWPNNPNTTFCCQASSQKDVVCATSHVKDVVSVDKPKALTFSVNAKKSCAHYEDGSPVGQFELLKDDMLNVRNIDYFTLMRKELYVNHGQFYYPLRDFTQCDTLTTDFDYENFNSFCHDLVKAGKLKPLDTWMNKISVPKADSEPEVKETTVTRDSVPSLKFKAGDVVRAIKTAHSLYPPNKAGLIRADNVYVVTSCYAFMGGECVTIGGCCFYAEDLKLEKPLFKAGDKVVSTTDQRTALVKRCFFDQDAWLIEIPSGDVYAADHFTLHTGADRCHPTIYRTLER